MGPQVSIALPLQGRSPPRASSRPGTRTGGSCRQPQISRSWVECRVSRPGPTPCLFPQPVRTTTPLHETRLPRPTCVGRALEFARDQTSQEAAIMRSPSDIVLIPFPGLHTWRACPVQLKAGGQRDARRSSSARCWRQSRLVELVQTAAAPMTAHIWCTFVEGLARRRGRPATAGRESRMATTGLAPHPLARLTSATAMFLELECRHEIAQPVHSNTGHARA